jgi:hypothetical protein
MRINVVSRYVLQESMSSFGPFPAAESIAGARKVKPSPRRGARWVDAKKNSIEARFVLAGESFHSVSAGIGHAIHSNRTGVCAGILGYLL